MLLFNNYQQTIFSDKQLCVDMMCLRSIKQAYSEDSSAFYTHHCIENTRNQAYVSMRLKGIILTSLFSKKNIVESEKAQLHFYLLKWHSKTAIHNYLFAIDKFMTAGKLDKQKVFYKLKIMARKQHKLQTAKADGQKAIQNLQIVANKMLTGHKYSHNRQKALLQINKLVFHNRESKMKKENNQNEDNKQQTAIPKLIQSDKNIIINYQANCNNSSIVLDKSRSKGRQPGYQTSINHILLQSESILSKQSMQNKDRNLSISITNQFNQIKEGKQQRGKTLFDNRRQKNNQSISNIDPVSGNLRIDLITCTNIFQSQFHAKSQKPAMLQLYRIIKNIQVKRLQSCFKLLNQASYQQNYQQQLLKARRNLQLVQQNFIVQCQMEVIAQNYQQQNQHLQNIDRNFQTLRKNFMLSKTISMIRVLKNLFYFNLRYFFNSLIIQKQCLQETKTIHKIYKVQQINSASEKSLPRSDNSIKYRNFQICSGSELYKQAQRKQSYELQPFEADQKSKIQKLNIICNEFNDFIQQI